MNLEETDSTTKLKLKYRGLTVAGSSPTAYGDSNSGSKGTGAQRDGRDVRRRRNGRGELQESDVVSQSGRRVAGMYHGSAGLGGNTGAVAQRGHTQIGGDCTNSVTQL